MEHAPLVCVLLASFLVHLCTNLANDYFDYTTGADSGASIGGSRVIQQGKISLLEIRNAMILLYAIAFVCGIWILWVSQVWWLAAAMVFSFFSSLFYTAPPIRYGYLGLGEVFVGLNMGPLMVVGTAAVLEGRFTARALGVGPHWAHGGNDTVLSVAAGYRSRQKSRETDCSRAARQACGDMGFRLFVAATLAFTVGLVLCGVVSPWRWLLSSP